MVALLFGTALLYFALLTTLEGLYERGVVQQLAVLALALVAFLLPGVALVATGLRDVWYRDR